MVGFAHLRADITVLEVIMIKENSKLLFIGDSITQCYRQVEDPEDLGIGYVPKIAMYLNAFYPHLNAKVINRGIGGDTAKLLRARWREDCLLIQPDYVTILVGINDACSPIFGKAPVPVEEFEADYRYLLDSVKANTKASIVLMEPFVLHYPADRAAWREDLNPKIDVVRKLAVEYQTRFIPLDGLYAAALAEKGYRFYSEDGVHPNDEGNALLAKAWLESMGLLKVL